MSFISRIINFLFKKNETKKIIIKEIKKEKVDLLATVPSPTPPISKKKRKKRKKAPLLKFEIDNSWDSSEFDVEPCEGKVRFQDIPNLPNPLLHGIYSAGYSYCTPIQAMILPQSTLGRDVAGKAQTGSGKTAAFLITIYKRIIEEMEKGTLRKKLASPVALIMAPTRELAMQIEKDALLLGKYTPLSVAAVFGGVDFDKQANIIRNKYVDILVATPGRLLDYKKNNILNLTSVKFLVIDEADRMLDMGFIPDMRRIVSSISSERQTLLFSATLNDDILRLANVWMNDRLTFEVEASEVTADTIEQRIYIATNDEKLPIIYNILKQAENPKAIIFANLKTSVKKLYEDMLSFGFNAGILSGDINQAQRTRTMERIKNGEIDILVATDVASRGLHITGVTHVFNYNLPEDPEDYVHRIGRTGRAGSTGISIAFATEKDAYFIPRIEEYTNHQFSYTNPTDDLLVEPVRVKNPIKAVYEAVNKQGDKRGHKHTRKDKKNQFDSNSTISSNEAPINQPTDIEEPKNTKSDIVEAADTPKKPSKPRKKPQLKKSADLKEVVTPSTDTSISLDEAKPKKRRSRKPKATIAESQTNN